MGSLHYRQSFCEEVSNAVLKYLHGQFQTKNGTKMCFVQRTMHPARRKKDGFTLSKNMVALLCNQLSTENNEEFHAVLQGSLNAVIEESKSWKIELHSWQQDGENYEVFVNKAKSYGLILKEILDFAREGCTCMPSSDIQTYNLLCHVDTCPSLDDLRSLLYCSLFQRQSDALGAVTLLSNGRTDKQKFWDLFQLVHLKDRCLEFATEETADLNLLKCDGFPKSFCDCLSSGNEENFPHLAALRRQDNRTAFHSRILSQHKNKTYTSVTRSLRKTQANRILHLVNQKNQVLAQQSELFHAWCLDTGVWNDNSTHDISGVRDDYLCHAGVQGSDKLDVFAYLEVLKKQIKESFEAKLQVNLEGDDWNSLFDKMLAAVIKLEFFHHSVSSKMKLSIQNGSLPTFATFILYNYSRLCMLLDSHSSKVEEGYYPALCKFEGVDFSTLVQEAEWELLIDHLWSFHDIISKPCVCLQNKKVEINCHRIVNELHKLSKSVSTLYSRHHIMGENFPHLLPMMNARIYLMKAARKAMSEYFHILGVEPMTQM